MKFLANTCKVLGYIWLVLACLLFVAATIGMWMKHGFSGIQALLNPFNVKNYITVVITFAPGIGLLMLSETFKNRIQNSKTNNIYPPIPKAFQ